MAETLNILRTVGMAGILTAAGIGGIRASEAQAEPQSPSAAALVDLQAQAGREETGKRFLDFQKGQSVLGDTIVTNTKNGQAWRYNCYYPNPDGAPRAGEVRYGAVEFNRADLKAAKNRGAVNCENVTPRPGPRKETGDGSIPADTRDFAYGYYFQDGDDGEVRYNVSIKPGDHPDGRIFYGVRNPRPGEAKEAGSFVSYDAANPRTGPRQETGAGGTLVFEAGAEVYGFNIKLNSGAECNPADENGSRTAPGCELVNAPMGGIVESGVVDAPPQEMRDVTLPIWRP